MIEVEIEDPAWTAALPEVEGLVKRMADSALLLLSREAGEVARRASGGTEGACSSDHAPPQSSAAPPTSSDQVRGGRHPRAGPGGPPLRGRAGRNVTILLTDDDAVRELNLTFRNKNSPTNVLSFPAAKTAAPHLGDIALAFGVCAREAAEQGKRFDQHVAHLVVHGVLHLLGYDHLEDADAETMESLERSIMKALGWPDPYAETRALEHHG